MHHREEAGYRAFCTFLESHPHGDNRACIQYVMRATGGTVDPNHITEWWQQWQIMSKSRATTGYTIRFFRDSNGAEFWCEMGPVNQPAAWDCGSLPLQECIRWAQHLIEEKAHDDAALTAPAAPAPPHTDSPAPGAPAAP